MNLVFDFGAVLFEWRPALLVQASFPAQAATPEAAGELAGAIFHHPDWLEFDRGVLALDAVVGRTAQRLGLPQAAVQGLMSGVGERLMPMADSVALLERLRRRRESCGDVRLYFLSNMPAPYARVLEQRHAFVGWFDGGIFSGDAKLIKPQPAIFELLQSRYALDPAKTIFIDDLPVNVQAARDCGWKALHFESAAGLQRQQQAQLG